MNSYAVALKDPAAELLAPAAFLAGLKACSQDVARGLLRAQPGFLGRNLQLAEARELAAKAARAGFGTVLAEEAALAAPPRAIEPGWIEPKGNGFNARAAGAISFIPYDSIIVFSAAAFHEQVPPASLPALKAGVLEKIARLAGVAAAQPPAPRQETFFRADIIAGEERLRLLLRPENLDFSPLGPGRSHASLLNFRALLDAVSTPAFKAVKNGFLKAFIA